MATYDLRNEVNLTSADVGPEVSEAHLAQLEMAPSTSVRPPRLRRSPIALECVYMKTVELEGEDGPAIPQTIVLGRVIGIYIEDTAIVDGRVDLKSLRPITRLGYMDYGALDTVFTMARPQTRGLS